MTSNLDIIRATYEGPSSENGKNLMAALSIDVVWTEAAGFPYAGTYHGPQAIIDHVFQRLANEWIDYQAKVHTYLTEGDHVAAFGVYSGTYRQTGMAMKATFAHLYRLQQGKIISMEQTVDSATVLQAMVPAFLDVAPC